MGSISGRQNGEEVGPGWEGPDHQAREAAWVGEAMEAFWAGEETWLFGSQGRVRLLAPW